MSNVTGTVGSLTSRFVSGAKAVAAVVPTAIGLAAGASGAAAIASAFKVSPQKIQSDKQFNGVDLTFPNDLIDDSASRNYYMTLRFVQYQRRSIFDPPFTKEQGGIRLPIPTNLVDSYSINYSEESAENPAVGAGIEGFLKGGNSVKSGGLQNAIGKIAQAGTAAIEAAGVNALTKAGDEALGKGASAQVLQLGGLAQNPFLTVMFKSPTFKRHQFSWKLTPNNEQESNTLNNIINALRYNILPGLAGEGGALLGYPNMCMINLSPNEEFLYKFKPCVATEMSVNFGSAGTPAFFKSAKPVEVTISISFLETEYWLRENIGSASL